MKLNFGLGENFITKLGSEVSTKSSAYESRWISESSRLEICKVTLCGTLPGNFVYLLHFGQVKKIACEILSFIDGM